MAYGLAALSASVFAGLDLLRADGPFLRVPEYRVTVEADSLSLVDRNAQIQSYTQMLTAVGQAMQQLTPMIEKVPQAAPAMMGIIIGFSRLANDSEILAFKASGISIYKILPPVVLVAALIAILTSYSSIVLIPVSEIAMKQLTYQLLKEKIDKVLAVKPRAENVK